MITTKKYFEDEVTAGARIHEAILFATRAHHGQMRKGSEYDYICHPMEVLQILTAMGAETEVLIAGILHDVVEDTAETLFRIRELFGDEVAKLVEGHTENKEDNWETRKRSLIEKLQKGSVSLKKMVLADKISNLRSIASDIKNNENVWDKFSVPKEREKWYYEQVVENLGELEDISGVTEFYKEMQNLMEQVFTWG